jgi:hypothetical protein
MKAESLSKMLILSQNLNSLVLCGTFSFLKAIWSQLATIIVRNSVIIFGAIEITSCDK